MERLLVYLPLLLLGCNLDSRLTGKDEGPGFDDGDPVDTGTDPVDELCNGLDDDGDGAVDEGFPDADGNGRVDCLDAECPALTVAVAGPIDLDPECVGAVAVDDPWNVTWSSRLVTGSGVLVMPAVGHLDDDDGDGLVGPGDVPEVAVSVVAANSLVVFDGATGAVRFEVGGVDGFGGVAIADVDGDDKPEVVAFLLGGVVAAIDAEGSVKWTSPADALLQGYPQLTVADLDGDGLPEVVADFVVFNGEDGTRHASMGGVAAGNRTPLVADLDEDGVQEIVFGNAVWTPDGAQRWSTPIRGTTSFPAVFDADGDRVPEVLFVQDATADLFRRDGTELASWTLVGAGTHTGPPAVADFDGDGEPEIAVPNGAAIAVYEVDGTPRWSQRVQDTTAGAGCSGFDLDGDGAYELLYADESTFWIFDGATGAVRYRDDSHGSTTVWEYPVPADVDGDGAAEILVARYSTTEPGVRIYDHAGAGWAGAGTTWAHHDYAPDRIGVDGSVPPRPPVTWREDNVCRARPSDALAVDLEAEVTDVCVADCEWGPVQVAVRVSNRGALDVAAGTTLALYAEDGPPRLVALRTLPEVPSGTTLDGVVFELSVADVGAFGFTAVVDDDGTGVGAVRECDEDNNVATYDATFCP